MTKDRIDEVYSHLTTVADLPIDEAAGIAPGTCARIAKATGMTTSVIANKLRRLKELNLVHIHRYARTTKQWAPVWVLGPGADAQWPTPPSQEELNAARREKRRLSGCKSIGPYGKRYDRDTQLRSQARELTEATIERTRRQPRQWFSWLGTAAETVES